MTNPKGCKNPLIYIIAGYPHDEDHEAGYPLSGAAGQYLLRVLSAYDVSDSVRIVNITPDDSKEVDPSYVINDLESLQEPPKVIVTLSSDVTQYILGPRFTTIRAMQGQVYEVPINGKNYKVVPAYSPGWILEELRASQEEDKYTTAPTEFAKSMYVVASIAKDEYVDILNVKKMSYCLTFDDFLNSYLNEGYVDQPQLAYDVETTAEPIMNENLEIIGFSNAYKNKGYYVCIEALDYKMTDEDKFKTFSLLKQILQEHKVIVHNSMYERPLTLKCVDYDIPYETLDDTLAMARLMLGGHVGAGLKLQAQTHCGYPDWETDLSKYMDAAKGIINGIYDHFYDRNEYPDIYSMIAYNRGTKWKQVFDSSVEEFKNVCYKYYSLSDTENLLKLIAEKAYIYVDKNTAPPKVLPYSFIPYKIICKYGALDSIATVDIYDHYTKWMKKESTPEVDLFKGYEVILKQMYAGYILERNGMYWDEKVARGRQEKWEAICVENLKSMIKSPYLRESMIDNNLAGYLPMALSIYYPEVAASQGYRIDYDLDTYKYKIYDITGSKPKRVSMSKIWDIKINDNIRNTIYDLMMQDIDTYTTKEQLQCLYNPSSSSENDIALEILYTKEAKIAMYIDKLATYARSVRYNIKLKSIFDKDKDKDAILACHSISTCLDEIADLKANRDIRWGSKKAKIAEYEAMIEMNKVLALTNDRIRNFVYNDGETLFSDPSNVRPYDKDEARQAKLSFYHMTIIQSISDTMLADDLDDEYLRLANDIWDIKSLKSNYPDSWWIERGKLFKEFVQLYEVARPHSAKLLSMMSTSEIHSMNEEAIIQMYVVYQYMGIDADNPSTWTDRYKWLIDYRIYKKLLKLLNAYLEGKVGRGSVYMVNKKSLSSGDNCVLRGRWYDPNAGDEEDYLLASSWAVATADTLRWRSGMHVIPWGSPIKKFYTSRFRGGTMLAPDYSQMEVRSLAGSSKDENMMEAFRQGLDFHRNTAALASRKDPSEVTDAERRFFKMATFSILYGAKVESFADNYCNGDLDQAKSIYEGFYKAYPKVKEWIDARHEEYKATGRVSTMTNFYVVIAPSGVENYEGSLSGALRKAQNYPIQSASSAVVGCVLFEVCNYLARNQMKSKPMMFVHDSIEVDVHPYELIRIVTEFQKLLYDIPNNQFGLPSKADFTMGLSIGHELNLKLWEPNEDQTSVHMILEGFKDELEETIENWKIPYDIEIQKIWHNGVDEEGNKIEIEGYEDKYIGYNELFVLKRAYNEYVGKTRSEGKVELTLTYKSDRVDCTR